MVMEGLGESLRSTLRKLANAGRIDAELIKEVTRDIQRALIQADMNVRLVLSLSKTIERRALEEKPLSGMSNREHVVRIVHDELVKLLGEPRTIPLKKQVIMMVGLYGQGKTTTTGKLALHFKKKGMRVGVIAADVHRPAAHAQLKTLADKVQVMFYGEEGARDAAGIVTRGLAELRKKNDILIVDTAGRDKLEASLIDEMKDIFEAAKPDEKFLVMDAAVGQQAESQAKAFHDAVQVTGVIITKLDGTAKGGGALSAVAVTKAPVVFIGTGEHVDELEPLDPKRFIGRLLGMGDLEALLEKANAAMEGKDAEKVARKMLTGRFTLNDMMAQMEMVNKMGPLGKVAQMLPGNLGQALQGRDMEGTQKKLATYKTIMTSMTDDEREDPNLLKAPRIGRIARGSGRTTNEVRELLKYYEATKGMMKGIGSNRKMQRNLMRQMGQKGGGRGGKA
ncbi:MAG: signal recognition particle subunit [Thermoplasmata archaeon]|jgi:signal recognition particle subunit SRP54|nr:signal recognition particle subunit [Thermoplasmata archaeon]